MPLEIKDLKELGFDNTEEIKKIMGRDNELLNMIKECTDKSCIKEKYNYNYNIYYYLYKLRKFIYQLSDYFNYEIDILLNSNISYYDIILNIFFLTLVVIVFIIMYWDSVYRIAKKNSRCSIMDTIITENKNIVSPYIYNIYIVDDNYKSSFITDYILCLTYDFTKNFTNVKDGLDKEYNKKYDTEIDDKKFKYYDLETNYKSTNNKINNDILKINNISYIITDMRNTIIDTEYANNLKKFIKEYNDDININNNPVFDIKYAYTKNISSDY